MPPSRAPIPIALPSVCARRVGQAGVDVRPFHAWIDAWEMRGLDPADDDTIAP
jgi:predicted secreted hydrolase